MGQTRQASRGLTGVILKLYGASDYQLTVTGSEAVTEHYHRVSFTGGGLLAERPLHPTMWVRGWFEKDGKAHQRGYTLVDPDPENDTFDMEFAIHDGAAADWALAARPGDILPVSFLGSKFELPDPAPTGWLIAGDPAALPAINSLLDAINADPDYAAPARIWFEYAHDSDRDLPIRLREHDTIEWIRRGADGSATVNAVREAAFDATGQYAWGALDAPSTRAVTDLFRNVYGLGKQRVKTQAYWRPE